MDHRITQRASPGLVALLATFLVAGSGCGGARAETAGGAEATAAAVASIGRPAPPCSAGSVWDGLECVPKEEPSYAVDDVDKNEPYATNRPLVVGESESDTAAGVAPDEAAYTQALDRYRLHDLTEMRRLLFSLIQSYPQSRRVGDAYYWFGVLFYDEAKSGDRARFELARVAFEQAMRYPQAETAPENLLKLAQTYDELGNVTSARSTYATLRARFPGSASARAIPFGH